MPRHTHPRSESDYLPNKWLRELAESIGIDTRGYTAARLISAIARATEVRETYRTVATALNLTPGAEPTVGEMELCIMYGTTLCHPISREHEPVLVGR